MIMGSPLVFGGICVAHLFSFLCCVFGGIRVAHHFSFLCCVFLFCLSLSCVLWIQCRQCLWIVHSWLPLRFSLTFINTWLIGSDKILMFYLFSISPLYEIQFIKTKSDIRSTSTCTIGNSQFYATKYIPLCKKKKQENCNIFLKLFTNISLFFLY